MIADVVVPWMFLIGLIESQPTTHLESVGAFRLGVSTALTRDFGERPRITGAVAGHLATRAGPLQLSMDVLLPRGPDSRDADVGARIDALVPLSPWLTIGAEYFGYDLEPDDVDGPGPHQYFGGTARATWGAYQLRLTPSIESFAGRGAPSAQVWFEERF